MTEVGLILIAISIALAVGSVTGRHAMLKDLDLTWEEFFEVRKYRGRR